MRRSLVPVLALAGMLSGALLPESTSGQQLRRVLEGLPDSARIRLLAPGVVVTDGRLLELYGDSLRLAEADVVLAVGLGEIEGLSVRASKWKKVGWQASAVGVVAGLMAGYMVGAYRCGDALGCDEDALRTAARWGVGLGVTGVVLGGLVGSRLSSWRVVFP